jgi:NAD(P)-dependent dehydrogenase (short-subunit alcohol dehydrogenase family)
MGGATIPFMPRRILIAAHTSSLSSELATAASEAQFRVVLTATGEDAADEGSAETMRSLKWNPRSLVSARAVVMKAANLAEGFDTAIVVCNPERHAQALTESTGGVIEDAVDTAVKGRLFVLKEIAGYFEKRGGGSIGLVSVASETTQAPLDAAVTGAFEALGDSLFLAGEGTHLTLRGYRFQGGEVPDFARYVMEQLASDSKRGVGKWFRYNGRSRLLSLR